MVLDVMKDDVHSCSIPIIVSLTLTPAPYQGMVGLLIEVNIVI